MAVNARKSALIITWHPEQQSEDTIEKLLKQVADNLSMFALPYGVMHVEAVGDVTPVYTDLQTLIKGEG